MMVIVSSVNRCEDNVHLEALNHKVYLSTVAIHQDQMIIAAGYHAHRNFSLKFNVRESISIGVRGPLISDDILKDEVTWRLSLLA